MPDKTFEQAMKERTCIFNQQMYEEVQKRLDFLQQGQTVEEATDDIPDLRMRTATRESLLFVYALSLGTSLCSMKVLTQEQADELRDYLSGRLAHTLTPPLFITEQE
jgi:hypothetical protein